MPAAGPPGRTPAHAAAAWSAKWVLAVAGAAIADSSRVHGAGFGQSGTVPYLSASAVLVAAGVGLLVNRRTVVRSGHWPPPRLPAWAGRRVGLARAAGSRAGSVLPALALMLT